MEVIKRDGRIVFFDGNKIYSAILKAARHCGEDVYNDSKIIAEKISNEIAKLNKKEISVEEIQDLIEKKLMASNKKEVAKEFIIYRNDRTRIRESNNSLSKEIADKIAAKNVENQNANVDERSFGGRMGAVNDAVLKKYALDNCMSKMSRNNHLNNEIYIHDLNSYACGQHNCLSIPFDDLLANGFNTRQTDVRPANSVSTAFQLLAVIFQIQSLQQFGGVSATHLDWTMVPYVRKSFYKHYKDGLKYCVGYKEKISPNIEIKNLSIQDGWYDNHKAYLYALDMTKKEIKQAIEGMYHNLNTLQSRSGNQLPFTSINYGTCTLPEGRMITKALLEGSISGTGKFHKTSIFPCGIFKCKKGINRK